MTLKWALFLAALVGGRALAEPLPKSVVTEPPAEPRLRPAAYMSFVLAAAGAGTAGYFAVQSNNARAALLSLPRQGVVTSISQGQALKDYNTATQNGQIAAALMGGAAAFAGLGAVLWWYGSKATIQVGPNGVSLTGTLP